MNTITFTYRHGGTTAVRLAASLTEQLLILVEAHFKGGDSAPQMIDIDHGSSRMLIRLSEVRTVDVEPR